MSHPDPQSDSLSSQLLPQLLDRVEHASPLQVLDVGLGRAETVDFFSERRCRLHFSSLYETLQKGQTLEEVSWSTLFRREMDYPAGTVFDLCLFWDFFNYLDDDALQAFSRALSPFTDQRTVGHGFAVRNSNTAIPGREYAIAGRDRFSIRPGRQSLAATHPRPQATLGRMLEKFSLGRSVLHRDGLLEVMLHGS